MQINYCQKTNIQCKVTKSRIIKNKHLDKNNQNDDWSKQASMLTTPKWIIDNNKCQFHEKKINHFYKRNINAE